MQLKRQRVMRATRRLAQRGLTLVEMMVGVAVGLFIVAAASLLVANQLTDTRLLTVETQISADLRATAELIGRDIRRAGHWNGARRNVWVEGGSAVEANPYIAAISPDSDGDTSEEITFAYSRAVRESGPGSDDDVITDEEVSGYRLQDGVIQVQLGNDNWQALTDPSVLRITQFDVTLDQRRVDLPCWQGCAPGSATCPAATLLREFTVMIAGEAVSDANIRRSVRLVVRPRNDRIVGTCP